MFQGKYLLMVLVDRLGVRLWMGSVDVPRAAQCRISNFDRTTSECPPGHPAGHICVLADITCGLPGLFIRVPDQIGGWFLSDNSRGRDMSSIYIRESVLKAVPFDQLLVSPHGR